jgi:hypothetical protein
LSQALKGEVQETPIMQQAWPIFPHIPQPPPPHVPWPWPQAIPAATHVEPVEWSQQPPLAHTLPSQQGWPAPPQATQAGAAPPLPRQVSPEAVQKAATSPLPDMQQASPAPPQRMPPPAVAQSRVVAWQVNVPAPPNMAQVPPTATQRSPKQQPPLQVLPAQQGCGDGVGLGAPQAVAAPLAHTMPLAIIA